MAMCERSAGLTAIAEKYVKRPRRTVGFLEVSGHQIPGDVRAGPERPKRRCRDLPQITERQRPHPGRTMRVGRADRMKAGIEDVLLDALGPRVEGVLAGAKRRFKEIGLELTEDFAILSEGRRPRDRAP